MGYFGAYGVPPRGGPGTRIFKIVFVKEEKGKKGVPKKLVDLTCEFVAIWVIWVIPNETAKVGYLEFQGTGLGSLENALKEKEAMMAMVGARLLEGGKRGVESAEATKVRQNIESSVLSNVVISVQHGILKALRFMGEWEGYSSNDI